MRHARRNLQRIARLAAVGGLVCGSLMVSDAMAGETRAPGAGTAPAVPAAAPGGVVVERLGTSRTAGSWIGDDGRPVVAVTDQGAAAEVRRAGANPKVVDHSTDELRSATETLRGAPRVTGTAWAVNYRTNEVVVRADRTVSASDWSRLTEIAEDIGGFVRMERSQGTFTTRLNGAAPMFGGASRCSAGFNVTDGQRSFVLTAGHCGPVGTTWFGDRGRNDRVGSTVAGSFPGGDYSLVRYDESAVPDPAAAGIVAIGEGRGVRITGAADPAVGQEVFRSGSTTGLRSGRVTALNATVNYPEGTVGGLIETTVCAEAGDSGGPLFAQGIALGVTSGGTGDCDSGGTTYFQPVTSAMASLGVALSGQPPAPPAGADGQPAAPADPSTPAAGGTAPDAGAGGGAAPPWGGTSGPGIVTDIAAGLGPLGAVAPGVGVIGASLVLLVVSRWIQTAQGRRNYREYYSQTWA
ncbi:S1 family peptidase [Streptomyces sp. NPDC049910]|uniref:S1 family peptidase n=1 Tax=Streptomyces sp. NPDC049910 TaxID=3155278 RepID=UPI003430D8B4